MGSLLRAHEVAVANVLSRLFTPAFRPKQSRPDVQRFCHVRSAQCAYQAWSALLGTPLGRPFERPIGFQKDFTRNSRDLHLSKRRRNNATCHAKKEKKNRESYPRPSDREDPLSSLVYQTGSWFLGLGVALQVLLTGILFTSALIGGFAVVFPVIFFGAFLIPLLIGFTALQAVGLFAFFLAPLAFLLAPIAAWSGLSFGVSSFFSSAYSSALSTFVLVNFFRAALRFSRGPQRKSLSATSSKENGEGVSGASVRKAYQKVEGPVTAPPPDPPEWLVPSFVSLVPGFNGAAFLMAISESSDILDDKRRKGFVYNALIYGIPGLHLLLKFLMGSSSGSWNGPWWLALILGAVHLQMEKKLMTEEIEASLPSGSQRLRGRKSKASKMKDEAEAELARMKLELEEFDAQLTNKVGPLGLPDTWTVLEVGQWLQQQGLARYVASFAEHDIDGKVLLELSMEEAREELGVQSLGDRKRLAAGLDQLHQQKALL